MRFHLSPDDDDFDFFDDDPFEDGEEQYEEEDFEDEEYEEERYEEASADDLPEIDDRAFASAEDFPDAIPEDFNDDPGTWSLDDYAASAANLSRPLPCA